MNFPFPALITAILAANILTVMLLLGMKQAAKVQKASDLSWNTFAMILIPLLCLAGGAYAYW